MRAWENFLSEQETELGSDTVDKWLKPLKILKFDACNLHLEAKDSFQAMWFEEHVRKKIQNKLFNNNRKTIRVHLTVANQSSQKGTKNKVKKTKTTEPQRAAFELTFDELDPHCSFEHFVTSERNILPHKLLCKITGYDPVSGKLVPTSAELASFNPIYLYGPSGTGKTHLLMATAQALRSKGLNVIYTRAETFTEHVVSAIRAGEMSTFRHAYRNIDTLFIDDVHVFSRKGATQEELFHTFNTLHLAGKQIILSANCSPGELQMIEPRLVSRFEWGIVLPLEPFSKEEVHNVLLKKAAAMKYSLNPKIAEYLEETFPNSPKSLSRALEALILRMHLNQGKPNISASSLTIPQVKNILADLVIEEQQNALTAPRIIKAVAEFFGIRPEDITGKGQSRDCVLPRQISMYLCRTMLTIPFMKIGDLFVRDHSTVMSSVKLIQKGIDSGDREIVDQVTFIKKKLRA